MTEVGIIADLLAVGGAALLLYTYNLWLLGRASEKWPQAEGVLDSAIVEEHQHSSRSGSTTDFTLAVRYHFVVGEQVFTGRRLTFGGTTYSRRPDAVAESEHLWHEAPLTVYYDPEDPRRSSLERGVGRDTYGALIASLLMLTISAVMVIRN